MFWFCSKKKKSFARCLVWNSPCLMQHRFYQTIYLSFKKIIFRPAWKYNIQANERLTKVTEKWSTVQFDVFDLSIIFFILMSQTISLISRYWCMLFFTRIKLVARVLLCSHAIAYIKCRRLICLSSLSEESVL